MVDTFIGLKGFKGAKMIKIICDRCGKEMRSYDAPTSVKFIMSDKTFEYDLCSKCMYEVEDFIVSPIKSSEASTN